MSVAIPPNQPSGGEPPSADEQHRAAERRFWERQLEIATRLNWITVGAVMVGAISLLFLWLSLRDAKKATEAATKQAIEAAAANKAAIANLQLTERPWISVSRVEIVKEWNRQPNGQFDIFLHAILRNTGTAPAVNGGFTILPITGTPQSSLDAWIHECDDADMLSTEKHLNPYQTGFAIAPNQTLAVRETSGNNGVLFDSFIKHQFLIVGCIIYYDSFKIRHHTRFCFSQDFNFSDTNPSPFIACGTAEQAD